MAKAKAGAGKRFGSQKASAAKPGAKGTGSATIGMKGKMQAMAPKGRKGC